MAVQTAKQGSCTTSRSY